MMDDDDISAFTPGAWVWKIEGDQTRMWSSAVGAYVAYESDCIATTVPDEPQLIAVLTYLGLPHP